MHTLNYIQIYSLCLYNTKNYNFSTTNTLGSYNDINFADKLATNNGNPCFINDCDLYSLLCSFKQVTIILYIAIYTVSAAASGQLL